MLRVLVLQACPPYSGIRATFVPAIWDSKAGGSFQPRSLRATWTMQPPNLSKKILFPVFFRPFGCYVKQVHERQWFFNPWHFPSPPYPHSLAAGCQSLQGSLSCSPHFLNPAPGLWVHTQEKTDTMQLPILSFLKRLGNQHKQIMITNTCPIFK